MIRRDDDNHWLLISQLEHARIAAELADAWRGPELANSEFRDELLLAIRHHDDGWADWEWTPTINEHGQPRDFTEMSMPVATSIWKRSIDGCTSHCNNVLDQFVHYLRFQRLRLTRERRAILKTIRTLPHWMTAEQLIERLNTGHQRRVSRSTVSRTLALLDDAGILERIETVGADWLWRVRAATRTRSPHGGLWVSNHFSYLAKRARSSRDARTDLNAIDGFLSWQQSLRGFWRQQNNLAEGEPVEELGFQWLQAFDRISLWLCCAHRSEAWQVVLPTGIETTFIPQDARTVAVDPFPFDGPVNLTAETTQLEREKLTVNEELWGVIRLAPRHFIGWDLVPCAPGS